MKATITKHPNKSPEFPCLMELYTKQGQGFKATGQIALMMEKGQGVIVQTGISSYWYVGYYSTDWGTTFVPGDYDAFWKPFKGSITLEIK